MKAKLRIPTIEERIGGAAVELLKAPASEKDISEGRGENFGTISERIRKRTSQSFCGYLSVSWIHSKTNC